MKCVLLLVVLLFGPVIDGQDKPKRIGAILIREGLCACEARNPSGMCCLGELNKTVNRLTETSQSR